MPYLKILMAALCMLLFAAEGSTTTWQTRGAGYWRTADTWLGNRVPPYSNGDTVLISHPVFLDMDISFLAGSYVLIDANGGLCGHVNMTAGTGSRLMKYGILEVDTMFVPGGQVLCRAPGRVIFTDQGHVSNGGLIDINGCSLAVGPWFNCKLPEYDFAYVLGINEGYGSERITLSPNPGNGQFVLTGHLNGQPAVLELRDLTGKVVYRGELKDGRSDKQAISVALPGGLYYWQLHNGHDMVSSGKVVIIP